MKRRFFIQKSTFGLISFSFIPSFIFSFLKSKNGINPNIIKLPASQKHVRHGLLNHNDFIADIPVSWLEYYQKDIFLKDGHLESADDLIHITFKIEGELINLGIKESAIFISNDERLDNFNLKDKNKIGFKIKEGYDAEIIKIKESYSFSSKNDCLIIPISSTININGITVDENSAFPISNNFRIEIQSIIDNKILLIKKLK